MKTDDDKDGSKDGNPASREIEEIEEEIRKTPYHKATQAHIGRLKAKLAKLRSGAEEAAQGKGGAVGYSVKKSGDATVLLVGFPSVGKSTLLTKLTNAESKSADYDFTTLDVIPGMLEYRGAKIQLLDIPGMIMGASRGKGRGRQVLSVVRNADLILIVVDREDQLEKVRRELYDAGFRLDGRRPDVRITRKSTGGLSINLAVRKPSLGKEAIRSVLGEFKVHNADVLIREDVTADQLIDSMMTNRVYVPSLVVVNKIDAMEDGDFGGLKEAKGCVPVSAKEERNLEALREAIWEKLGLIRVYMKRLGREPDMEEPLIMKGGSTVMDAAGKTLRKAARHLRYARVWGPSAKFGGQQLGPRHVLLDGDVVELHA